MLPSRSDPESDEPNFAGTSWTNSKASTLAHRAAERTHRRSSYLGPEDLDVVVSNSSTLTVNALTDLSVGFQPRAVIFGDAVG